MNNSYAFLFSTAIFLLFSCSNKYGEADAYGSFEAEEIIVSAEGNGKIIELNLEEDSLCLYLNWLDKLTYSHIKILVFFSNPSNYIGNKQDWLQSSPMERLISYDAVYGNNKDMTAKLVKDLFNDGLLTIDILNTTMTAQGSMAKRTTELADAFLTFVSTSKEGEFK